MLIHKHRKTTQKKEKLLGIALLFLLFDLNAYSATKNSAEFFDYPLFSNQSDLLFDFNENDQYFDSEELLLLKSPEEMFTEFTLRGFANIRKGKNDFALKDLEAAWKISPDKSSIGVTIGFIYLKEKRYNDVLTVAKKLQNSAEPKPFGPILEGFAYKAQNHLPRAIDAFKLALEIDPGNPTATEMLAEFALSNDEIDQAKQLYLESLKSKPNLTRTLFLLARLEKSQGNSENAIDLIKKASNNYPNTLRAHNELAMVYAQLQENKLAIEEITKALQFDPHNAPTLFMQAKLLAADGQLEEAKKTLQTLTTSHPKNTAPLELNARIALAQNDMNEAIKQYTQALRINNSTHLAIQLATTQLKAGKTADGLSTLHQQVKKEPENILLRSAFAELLRKNDHKEEALQQYKKILELEPSNAAVKNNYAWLLAKEGNIKEAVKQAKQAHALSPSNPLIMDTYGIILLKDNNKKLAESVLTKAANALPDNPTIRFHLAQVLIEMNRNKLAKNLLTEILSQKQDFDERPLAEELLKNLNSN